MGGGVCVLRGRWGGGGGGGGRGGNNNNGSAIRSPNCPSKVACLPRAVFSWRVHWYADGTIPLGIIAAPTNRSIIFRTENCV